MEKFELNEEEKIRYQITLNLERQISELSILRYQAIAIIAGLSMAIAGVTISFSSNMVVDKTFLFFSFLILICVTLVSLLIYLGQTRDGFNRIKVLKENITTHTIMNMPPAPKPKYFYYWPEILFIFFSVGILFFLLFIIDFAYLTK